MSNAHWMFSKCSALLLEVYGHFYCCENSTLWNRYYYCPHFLNKKTEAKSGGSGIVYKFLNISLPISAIFFKFNSFTHPASSLWNHPEDGLFLLAYRHVISLSSKQTKTQNSKTNKTLFWLHSLPAITFIPVLSLVHNSL